MSFCSVLSVGKGHFVCAFLVNSNLVLDAVTFLIIPVVDVQGIGSGRGSDVWLTGGMVMRPSEEALGNEVLITVISAF